MDSYFIEMPDFWKFCGLQNRLYQCIAMYKPSNI